MIILYYYYVINKVMRLRSIWSKVFDKSVKITCKEHRKCEEVKRSTDSIRDKSSRILKIKNKKQKELLTNKVNKHIKNNFYFDWAIKLSKEELSDETIVKDLSNFTYKSWDDIVFRWMKYYNLFNSVKISWLTRNCSINNIKIEDINIDSFINELLEHDAEINLLLRKYNSKITNNNIWKNEKPSSLSETYKKIVLWLLDAKINNIAFILNILLILWDKNFLNQDFIWTIIFNKDDVTNIKNYTWELFNNFIKSKEWFSLLKDKLQWKLEKYCWLYTKLLIGNKLSDHFQINNLVEDDINNNALQEALNTTIKNFFILMDSYVEKYKIENENKKIKYKSKNWSEEWFNDTRWYNNAKSNRKKAYQKLIRLYREENNQLMMLKTWINAYYYLLDDRKNTDNEVRLVSVNYWWITISSYVKPLLQKLLWDKKYISNNIITYSIYDLKNKSPSLELEDYPFSWIEKVRFDTLTKVWEIINVPNLFYNWFWPQDNKVTTIIFDDNSHSWETLFDLKVLFRKKWYYNLHLMPCRSNFDLSKYTKKINEDEIIDLLIKSWASLRWTLIWSNSRNNYKDLIATIIWNRIYKLSRNV